MLGIYYLIGCVVGTVLIAITNSVALVEGEVAPYHYAWFSWGFVFWFVIMFIWLIFNDL
jgi:branched-subunit amino acid ABC-type transport system permease component